MHPKIIKQKLQTKIVKAVACLLLGVLHWEALPKK